MSLGGFGRSTCAELHSAVVDSAWGPAREHLGHDQDRLVEHEGLTRGILSGAMGDFSMFRGDTFPIQVQVTKVPVGSPPGTPPVPVDVTGWKFWFSVKRYYADPDNQAVFQTNSTDGTGAIVFTTPTAGIITCTMPALATVNFPDAVTQLVYDVQGKDLSGNVSTVDVGTIEVTPDVTRATS